ncbi:DNA-binding transcriptional regulator AraC [compost metagenome]
MAKAMIERDCNIRIYELALAVGYQDAKHFSKVFRECTGMMPREYMERTFAQSDGGRVKEV